MLSLRGWGGGGGESRANSPTVIVVQRRFICFNVFSARGKRHEVNKTEENQLNPQKQEIYSSTEKQYLPCGKPVTADGLSCDKSIFPAFVREDIFFSLNRYD